MSSKASGLKSAIDAFIQRRGIEAGMEQNFDEGGDPSPVRTGLRGDLSLHRQGKVSEAIGFMIASNVYTTVAYVIHDRAWARVKLGAGGT